MPNLLIKTRFAGKIAIEYEYIEDLQTLTTVPTDGTIITNLTLTCGSGICGLVTPEELKYYEEHLGQTVEYSNSENKD